MSEVLTRFRLLRTPLLADRVCDAFEVPPLNELGLLAQLVEQVTLNHRVGGSSPSQPTYVGQSEGYIQTLDVVQNLE